MLLVILLVVVVEVLVWPGLVDCVVVLELGVCEAELLGLLDVVSPPEIMDSVALVDFPMLAMVLVVLVPRRVADDAVVVTEVGQK